MSEEKARELIERYVYDVTRRLPQGMRGDVEKELKSNIEDMLASKSEGYSEQDVADVLTGLGSPAELAASYNDTARALISGSYYDKYTFILKIVLSAVALGITIAAVVGFIASPGRIAASLAAYIGDLFFALLTGFAFVTLIFAIIERQQVKLDMGMEPWSVDNLKPVPREEAIIKKSEPITGIIFTVAVIMLFNFVPQFFGIYDFENGVFVASMFRQDVLQSALPIFTLAFFLGIVREVLRVAEGRYTVRLTVAIVLLDIISLALVLSVVTNPNLWNADMLTQLQAHFGWDVSGLDFLGNFGQFVSTVWIVLMVLAFVLDSASALYKCIRYRAQ